MTEGLIDVWNRAMNFIKVMAVSSVGVGAVIRTPLTPLLHSSAVQKTAQFSGFISVFRRNYCACCDLSSSQKLLLCLLCDVSSSQKELLCLL